MTHDQQLGPLLLLIACALLGLSGCDKVTCEAEGGEWRAEGPIVTQGSCAHPTSDGGAVCTDGSECEGYCLAPAGAEYGDQAEGTCSEWDYVMCRQVVQDGEVTELPRI